VREAEPDQSDAQSEAHRRITDARRFWAVSLDLSGLGLTRIPDAVCDLEALENLNIADNHLREVPACIVSLKKLRRLNADKNSIEAIGDFVSQLPELRDFSCSSNQISTVPESFGAAQNVLSVNLSDNSLVSLPGTFGRLPKLLTLDISRNTFHTIPECLGCIISLQALNIARNRIQGVPESLSRLVHLQSLNLSGNRLQDIPKYLGELNELRRLDLSSNDLSVLPDSVAALSLTYLDLTNNRLTSLPLSLGRMETLTELYLHGNSDLGIPPEILGPSSRSADKAAKAPRDILNYYYTWRTGSRPLNEAKLILVGRGGVGKTSLVNVLTTGHFDVNEDTTQGIKINDWSRTLRRGHDVVVHVWDFGGQEMMHATHQFFLTARSLYLLVLNRRQGGYDDEADYWFRVIRAFGGKTAPVIVVLNRQLAEPFDVNRGGWQEKYPENVKGFVETDCGDLASVHRLEKVINKELDSLKSVKSSFPVRWFGIKDELSKMEADYVTFEEYRGICLRWGESDTELQASLATFLHDLGIALSYRDDPRLRFAYVLKPEWVTRGIYALLHAFVVAKGLFSSDEAETVLADKGYSSEGTQFLLGLMEQFELSFPLGNRKKESLIPELLEERQPKAAGRFHLAKCLNFGYRYPIVPEGLLPRFIVRTHHLSRPGMRWRSGVILRHAASGCRALVKADTAERHVRIYIEGPEHNRRELLAIIRDNFEVIHSDYDFTPDDLVYPFGVLDKPLVLEELKALHREGLLTVPVVLQDQKVIRPHISELLDSVDSKTPKFKVFISYAREEEGFVDELRKALKPMERNGLIRIWSDRSLLAGEAWQSRILEELNEADIVICQLSRNFLASDFCMLKELEVALKRKEHGEAEIIAYVLKECAWAEVPRLNALQILPMDAKPINRWRDRDEYWRSVADGIQAVLLNWRNASSTNR
jgi:internalin A